MARKMKSKKVGSGKRKRSKNTVKEAKKRTSSKSKKSIDEVHIQKAENGYVLVTYSDDTKGFPVNRKEHVASSKEELMNKVKGLV
jgi:hypothetical protein